MRAALAILALVLPALAQASDLAIVGRIKGADGPWDYASVDSEANRLLVGRGDGVMAVDLASGAVIPSLVPGKRVHGVIALPGGLAASANGNADDVTLFKVADGTVVADIPVGRKPDALVRDPKSGLVAVMNGKDGTVSLIDVGKRSVAGTISVGGALEFAVADGEGRIFVNIEDRNELVTLDIAGRKVSARHALPGCDGPSGLALDAAHHLLLSVCSNGKAVATSSIDGHVVATLPIGSRPDAALYDEKNKRFLVPCGGSGVLSVISDEDGRLASAGTVPTEKSARTAALDPATGRIYLPAAQFQPAKPGERPAAVPGSFHVLVLGEK